MLARFLLLTTIILLFVPAIGAACTCGGSTPAPAATAGSAQASPVVQRTATAEAQKPTPTEVRPTSTPESSLVKLAMEKGKLELKGEANEWEKYFIALTPEEAERLLQEANRGVTDAEKLKLLLPFDPRGAPNLEMATFEFEAPGGVSSRAIGTRNLPKGTVLYSPVSGEAFVSQGLALGGTLLVGSEIKSKNSDIIFFVVARRENSQAFIPRSPDTPVNVGTPLFSLGNTETVGFYPGNQQVVGYFYRLGVKDYRASLSQFLLKEGKIVFVGQP